jgi:hypothetical protein
MKVIIQGLAAMHGHWVEIKSKGESDVIHSKSFPVCSDIVVSASERELRILHNVNKARAAAPEYPSAATFEGRRRLIGRHLCASFI